MRGLKHLVFRNDDSDLVAPLVGAWIETRNGRIPQAVCKVAPLVGAWIETILCASESPLYKSHPSWVRGLKQQIKKDYAELWAVAPLVGAWIETQVWWTTILRNLVAPLVGAWIETVIPFTEFVREERRTPRGCVD